MRPIDLPAKVIRLPESGDHRIVILTGGALRHKRFALRIQQEFGDQVAAWFELGKPPSGSGGGRPGGGLAGKALEYLGRRARRAGGESGTPGAILASLSKRSLETIRRRGAMAVVREAAAAVSAQYALFRHMRDAGDAEQRLFGREVERLSAQARLRPIRVTPEEVNSPAFADRVRALDPYFLLTLGGPLYRKALLDSVRGTAINQHAGHSPAFKGSNTTEWALYHRRYDCISSTVHITTTGADAGPILRRSNPCVAPTDSLATIFLRVVALGTELMIESVRDIMESKDVLVHEQPTAEGKTYISQQMSGEIIGAIRSDLARGWLRREMIRCMDY